MAKPTVTPHGDTLEFLWEQHAVAAIVDVTDDDRDAIWVEILFRSATNTHLHRTRLNLLATQSRAHVIKELTKRGPTVPWGDVIEQIAEITITHVRRTPDVVDLSTVVPASQDLFIDSEDLVPAGKVAMFYGPGGSMKSLFALAYTGAMFQGVSFAGIHPLRPVRGLYVDYEDDAGLGSGRLRAICRGHEMPVPHLDHVAPVAPLPACARWLRAEVSRRKVNLVVIDSYIAAAGADPETSGTVERVHAVLRSLGPDVSSILINHIPKAEFSSKRSSPFGSVMGPNRARTAWQFTLEDDVEEKFDGDLRTQTKMLGVTQYKSNYGSHAPLAFKVTITGRPGRLPDLVTFDRTDITESISLSEKAGTVTLIEACLAAENKPVPVDEIAAAIGKSENATTTALRRHPERFVQVGKGGFSNGKPQKATWGLKSARDAKEGLPG